VHKDAAFCYVCYLFKDSCKFAGVDAFVDGGFRNRNMKARIKRHAGKINSAHSEVEEKYNMFMRPKASVRESVASNTPQFKADMFLGVIDRQLQELNNRFDEVNIELLRCMSAFNPANSFSGFDIEKLVKLAGFYPHDFDLKEINQLRFQLRHYIARVRNDENFRNLRSLSELSMMIVRDLVSPYGIVYQLLKLVLVLPVATAVLRVFFLQ